MSILEQQLNKQNDLNKNSHFPHVLSYIVVTLENLFPNNQYLLDFL